MSEANGDDYSIAVIGMAGRFPGAADVGEFWENLCRGVESVHRFSEAELIAAGEPSHVFSHPDYVPVAPVLEGIDRFDASFFGLSPGDASLMDPQHRLFLEIAWHALENAGYAPGVGEAPVGVFAACGMNSYMMHHLVTNRHVMETVGEWLVRHAGNDMNFLATRVSYQMNLKGPSANVQTACSSSLVATHWACQSLLSGECELALAGASTIVLPQDRGYLYKDGEIMSSTGHCRPFDAKSDGTLFGSGAGCLVLKRLDQARADGDNILAIIRGSAINNDGSEKVGYLAPSVEGQARVIAEALGVANLSPRAISFVETHGTGTAVGDPIELTALASAFDDGQVRNDKCVIGSVKANIGHLGEAAGMASLIKTILSLQHRKLPPTINYTSPNPRLELDSTPFEIRRSLSDWSAAAGPRVAGVTSLGAGGTNAHVLIEEAAGPALPRTTARSARPELLVVSAKAERAARQGAEALANHLAQSGDDLLSDIAHTLQQGRREFPYRTFVVARSPSDAASALVEAAKNVQFAESSENDVIFMFPGGGAQYEGMGRELYEQLDAYREAVDECLALLPLEIASEVRRLVLKAPSAPGPAASELERPSLALPALFATEYALAVQLENWGIRPQACIGHSMGEYVAACLSGVFSLADALMLVLARGRLFETLPAGAMLSVEMSEEQLAPLLGAELSIAAVNAETLCVASGPVEAISALEQKLRELEVEATRLHISVAAHSSMLEPILSEFELICRRVRFGEVGTPFVSTLTGDWIKDSEALDPRYWVKHLRGTVRFSQSVRVVLGKRQPVLVEVGPGRTLASLSRMHGAKATATTLRHPNEVASDVSYLLATLGRAWQFGAKLDFSKLRAPDAEAPRRVALPGYQFQRESYWIKPGERSEKPPTDAFTRIADLGDWFQVPAWHQTARPPRGAREGNWLLVGGPKKLAERLASGRGSKTVIATAGPGFSRRGELRYELNMQLRGDWDQLFEDLRERGLMPDQIVHLTGLTSAVMDWSNAPAWLAGERYAALEERYFFTLLPIAQALSRLDSPITLTVVANRLFRVDDGAAPEPHKSLLLGPALVVPRELPHVRSRCIDFDAHADAADHEALLHELEAEPEATAIALRRGTRWTRRLVPSAIGESAAQLESLPEACTVVISGGLGGIGLTLAKHLARVKHAKLVLLGRSALPPKEQWSELVAQRSTEPVLASRLRQLLELESLGGQVLTFNADVTKEMQIASVRSEVRAKFGPADVVIHAAGSIHDAPLDLKTADETRAVIATKALGAVVLESVFGRDRPRLFVACSSVASILGLPGQIDYAAANAFLDAFVESAPARGKFARAISIGWNAWRDVGMAVALAERASTTDSTLGVKLGPHPCLERVVTESDSQRVFGTQFSRMKHWLVGEHVVANGDALIPGTGYLELARAGLELDPLPAPVRLTNVTFASPFFVPAGASRELFLDLTRETAERFAFSFYSSSKDDPHVFGTVEYVDELDPMSDLGAVLTRLQLSVAPGPFLDQSFMDFGPRWGNIRGTCYGRGEALIHLQLPDEFASDLRSYRMHPALLDMATGGAQRLIPDFDPERDFYVPFAYESVTLYADMSAESYSHVRLRSTLAGVALFDVTQYAPDGSVILEARGFTMKRIERQFSSTRESAPPLSQAPKGAPSPQLRELIQTGIAPAEGVDAFTRLIDSGLTGTVYTSSIDVNAWLRQLDATETASDAEGASGFERPSLETTFVAPRNQVEQQLANFWSELLGMKSVGMDDDFFELGGHSLLAVRLFNKIRRELKVDLPLSVLFEAPTIATLSRVVAEDAGVELEPLKQAPPSNGNGATHAPEPLPTQAKRWTSLIKMQPRGDLTPFFCVAGMGGNLHNLRKLALFLGQSRPVYGLQPPGANDASELLYTVEALAEHYINALRTVRPHGPYCLGGYSGGGVVAFEMARQLSAAGEQIAFLGFLDSFSPAIPKRGLTGRARIHFDRLRQLGAQYALGTVRRRLQYERQRLGMKLRLLTMQQTPAEGEQRYEAVAASWMVASERYQPGPLAGSATLFRAKEPGVLSNWTAFEVDEQYGWGSLLTQGVHVEVCPGSHADMCEEPHVRTLAAKLRDAIDRAALDFEGQKSSRRRFPDHAQLVGSEARLDP